MLAFEDYASAHSKATSVFEVLNTRIDQAINEVNSLSKDAKDAQIALSRLDLTAQKYSDPGALAEAVDSLARRVTEAGLTIHQAASNRAFVRACRAAIQKRYSERAARVNRLTAIVERVGTLPIIVQSLSNILERQASLERELAEAEEALVKAEQAQTDQELLANELDAKR